ncbi:MAG: hypothetical protein NTZ05_15155 [Chloroflexi bacterium]|nr:hypothetical protein [Chloroflexota bacterium]
MLSRPAVDGLERELAGRARLLRLNILDTVGRTVAETNGVDLVPAFLVFGPDGVLATRIEGRVPGAAEVLAALNGERAH